MKWIGQNIYDLISRFRNDVYLEDISTGTIASGAHLGLDSNNKIVKAADGGGDLTSIVAGTGLGGTSLTGPIPTLNIDASQPTITTLAGVNSLGVASATTNIAAGDLTMYGNVNDGNPTFSIGSSATNKFEMVSTYNSGAQTLDSVSFNSYTTSTTTNDGRYFWRVDEVLLMALLDAGATVYGSVTAAADGAAITSQNTTASSATEGGKLTLRCDDGAAMADDHRLGVVEFSGAEDASNNRQTGARIQAMCDAAWSASENGTRLEFYTMDGNAASELSLTLDSDLLATFAGAVTVTGALTGTLATAAQTNITSLGTLTALDVDNININGDTITASGDMELVATGNDIAVDTNNFVIESSAAHLPKFEIKSTGNSTDGGHLRFNKDRGAAQVNNDTIGTIFWAGENDAEEQITYGSIRVQALEVDDTDEAGKMSLRVTESNGTATGLTTGLLIEGSDNVTDGEVNVTIAAGGGSVTTIAGNLDVTGKTIGFESNGDIDVAGAINLGNPDTTLARSAAGVVTIEGKTIATTNKTIALYTSNFHSASTSAFYVPFNFLNENANLSTASYFLMISVPYDGRVLKVSSFTQGSGSKTTTVEMYKNGDDSDLAADQVGTDLDIGTYNTNGVGVCATDWAFSAGDSLSFRVTNSAAGSGQVLTFVVEFDLDT